MPKDSLDGYQKLLQAIKHEPVRREFHIPLPQNSLTEAMKEVIALKMFIIDEFIEEYIKPLKVTTNPEKLIGKPYEQWTPIDKQMLSTVYGTDSKSKLIKTIVNNEYDQVRKLEAEL